MILCGQLSLTLRASRPAPDRVGGVARKLQNLRKNQIQGTPTVSPWYIRVCGRQGTVCQVHRLMPVTCLHSQVPRPCIIVHQLTGRKASLNQWLTVFCAFFWIFQALPGWRALDVV